MKSLKIIQTLFKVARILALVFFILSIIGTSGCFLAVVILSALRNAVLNTDGQTLAEIMANNGVDINAVIVSIILGMIACGCSIFLCKYSEIYFLKELKAGTPFTREQVKEMRKYGIVYIITSVAVTFTISLVYGICRIFIKSLGSYDYSFHFGSIIFGVFMIVLSVFCQYSVEKEESETKDEFLEEPEPEEEKE